MKTENYQYLCLRYTPLQPLTDSDETMH